MTHIAVTDWLDAAQARAAAASDGPWTVDPGGDGITGLLTESEGDGFAAPEAIVITDSGAYPPNGPTAEFIAAARTDVPRLIEAVRSVLDVAEELATRPAVASALLTATRLQDAVYTALFPAPEATDA